MKTFGAIEMTQWLRTLLQRIRVQSPEAISSNSEPPIAAALGDGCSFLDCQQHLHVYVIIYMHIIKNKSLK